MKFTVQREHLGDRFYKTGDTREADEIDVVHLVNSGILVPKEDVAPVVTKMDKPLKNKGK